MTPTRSLRLATPLLAAALCLAPAPAVAAPMVINAKAADSDAGWKWAPKVEHVVAPQKVKWKNSTGEDHSVKFYKGPWKGKRFLVPEGEAKIRKIKKDGTYKFRCDILQHSTMDDGKCTGMCGKIVAH